MKKFTVNAPSYTESVCPVCLQKLPAQRISLGEEVYLEKTCPTHGEFRTLIWRGNPDIVTWVNLKTPSHPAVCYTDIKQGCPYDCGLCPAHRQHTCTALLEVTQRCNLNCSICFADAGGNCGSDPSLALVESWYQAVRDASGPCNIQLSGGEPTLRDDLPDIVSLGRRMGFDFIQINTNGLRLASDPSYAVKLSQAGLSSAFLQFDGTDESIYEQLRGQKLLEQKKAAIRNCADANIGVVLVPTLVPSVNIGNIGSILRFAIAHMPTVRGVHFQPVSYFGRYAGMTVPQERITIPDILRRIEQQMDGAVTTSDFRPPGCEHALCSFHGKFITLPDGTLKSVGMESNSCCQKTQTAAEGATKTKRFVSLHWGAPQVPAVETSANPSEYSEWDHFIDYARSHTLTISGMAFQDAWSLDLERLKSCCIHVVSPDGRLIPFCAYNVTDVQGRSLYRNEMK